jgi:hypothetical protein
MFSGSEGFVAFESIFLGTAVEKFTMEQLMPALSFAECQYASHVCKYIQCLSGRKLAARDPFSVIDLGQAWHICTRNKTFQISQRY